MNKILAAMLLIGSLAFAVDILGPGLNYITFNSTDSVSVASESLFSRVYTLQEIYALYGVMWMDCKWIRIGTCSTGVKVGVYEGNEDGDWDLNTVLMTKRGAASGDTTFQISLAPTTYFKFWVICDDNGDSCYVSRDFNIFVR